MRKFIASLALIAVIAFGISQIAALPPANTVTRFPGAIYAYKYITGTFIQGRDSVGSPRGSFTYLRADSASIGGYGARTYSVLDSAKTGYAAIVTDTLRLVCGANVNGYFVAGITGTGSGTAMTLGTLPALCRPSHTVVTALSQFTDKDTTRLGWVSIATTGIMTVQRTDGFGRPTATLVATGVRAVLPGATFTFSRF